MAGARTPSSHVYVKVDLGVCRDLLGLTGRGMSRTGSRAGRKVGKAGGRRSWELPGKSGQVVAPGIRGQAGAGRLGQAAGRGLERGTGLGLCPQELASISEVPSPCSLPGSLWVRWGTPYHLGTPKLLGTQVYFPEHRDTVVWRQPPQNPPYPPPDYPLPPPVNP